MGVTELTMVSIIPLIGLGVTIYAIILLSRLVKAIERIADKMDK
jgi:hypothetical protein